MDSKTLKLSDVAPLKIEGYTDRKLTKFEQFKVQVKHLYSKVDIFFNNICVSIQNLKHYYPVISHCLKTVWKDRYWDYEYFFLQFLKFQLISTRDGILKEDLILEAPNVADEINHMLELINVYEHYDDIFEGNNQEMIEQIGVLGLDEETKNERIKNYVIKLNMFEQKCYNEMMDYLRDNLRKWWS